MADRWFIDGFEGGNTGLWTTHSGTSNAFVVEKTSAYFSPTGDFSQPTVGDYAFYLDGSSTPRLGLNLVPIAGSSVSAFYFKFRLAVDDSVSTAIVLYLENVAGTTIGSLTTTNNRLSWVSGSGGTIVHPTVLDAYVWNLIEVFIQLSTQSDTDGAFALRVNGDSGGMTNSINVCTNTLTADNMATALTIRSQNSKEIMIDDFVLTAPSGSWDQEAQDADVVFVDLPGDGYILGLFPVTEGGTSEWSGDVVDASDRGDKTTVDATYYTEETDDHTQEFTNFGVLEDMDTIYAVQVCARTKREGTPDSNAVKLYVTSDTHISDNISLSVGSYKTEFHIWNTNPVDSSEWTYSDIENLVAGVVTATE